MKGNSGSEDDQLFSWEIDAEFDSITHLVEILTGAPISLIYKVEEEQVIINSCKGLGEKDIPNNSFLAEFINSKTQDILILPDAKKDPRFSKNPLVNSSPGFVFYIGVPLMTSDGHFWGMLCAIDYQPRELEENKVTGLKILAGQVTKLIELKKTHTAHEVTKNHLENETTRLNNILEATQVGTYDWDILMEDVIINEEYVGMVGYTLAELTPFTLNTFYKLLHPEDRGLSEGVVDACFKREIDYFNIEYRLIHKEGHDIWVNDRGRVTKWSDDGKPLKMSGTHTNITNRKNSEIQFQTVADNIPGVVYRFKKYPDGKDTFEFVSNGAFQLWGFTADQIINKSHLIGERCHKEDKVTINKSASDMSYWLGEYKYNHPDGSVRWHKGAGSPHTLEDGSVVWDVVILDISKRKEAEIGLKENEKRFKALIENGRDAIAIFDANGVQKFISSSISQVLGYTEEEAFHLKLNDTVHPEDQGLAQEKIRLALASEGVPIEGYVTRSRHKDGSWRWMESTLTNFLNDPNIRGLVDNFRDITDKVELNEQLTKSERRFKALVQEGSDLTTILSLDVKYIYVSPNYPQILGYEVEDLIGNSAKNNFHPDDLDRVMREFSEQKSSRRIKLSPYRYKRKSGTWCWLLSTVTNLSDDPAIGGMVVNSVEITDLIEAQEKLKTSEARYKGFYESQTTFVIRTDLKGKITYTNAKYMETLNWLFPNRSYEGINVIDTVLSSDREKINVAIEKCLKHPEKVFKVQLRKLKEGSSFHTTLWDFVGILGPDGLPIEIQCNGIDISERIAFEEELKKSNERFELVMQTDAGSIWDLDLSTGDMFLGKGFSENYGFKIEKPSENYANFCESIHGEDFDLYINKVQHIIHNSLDKEWVAEYRFKKSNEEHAYLKEKTVILRDKNGLAYRVVGAIKDITLEHFYGELEAIEKELMEGSMNQEAKLTDLLQNYLCNLEVLFPSMKTAVFKVFGNRLQNLATPSLINQANLSLKDFDIYLDDEVGIDDTYDFINSEVFITDISKEKRCRGLVEFANKIGVSTCWSLPIFNSDGEIIALFLNFFEHSRKPRDWESYGVQRSQRLLSMLLTKFEYLESLFKSNERFTYVNMATNDAIYDWDFKMDQFHWGEGFYRIFGYEKGEEINKISEWRNFMHPADSSVTDEIWDDFIFDPSENSWHKEYRFLHKSGNFLHVEEIGFMIRDISGRPLRMIGVLRDVSEAKKDFFQKEVQHEITNHFMREVELKDILHGVLKYISKISNFSGGEVWLLGKKEVKINLLKDYWRDENPKWLKKDIIKVGHDLASYVLDKWEFLASVNLMEDSRFEEVHPEMNSYINAIIGIPLIQNNFKVGVMLLYFKEDITLPKDYKSFFAPIGALLGGEIKRKQQEEEMKLLFESAPELLSIIEPSGYFVKVNPSFCNLFGYREEEMLTKKFEDLIHPEDKDDSNTKFSIVDGIQAKNLINRYRTRSGQYRWISWNSSDDFGEEGLVFFFGHDITEMVALQHLLDNASKLSRMGSWEIDLINNNLYLSTTSKDILGFPQNSSPSLKELLFKFKDEDRNMVENSYKSAVQKGETWDYQLPIVLKNGEERWVRSIGQVEINDNSCSRIFGSLQDIHIQKSNEIELAKNNQLLEVISKVIEKFLLVEDWKRTLEEVFTLTRKAVEVDRINFFQKQLDAADDKIFINRQFNWRKEKNINSAEVEGFAEINMANFPQILSDLENGRPYFSSTNQLQEGRLKSTLEAGGILSILIIPVVIDNNFIGFIGFDDCTSERNWTESEISFLLTITSNLSAAIQRSNSQLALKRSYEEKNAILESVGEAFFALDKDFNILYWNQRAEEIIGVSRSEAINKALWDVFPGIKNSIVQEQLIFASEKHSDVHFEMFSEDRNIWLDISGYPSSEGISVFIKDVTREKITSEKIQLSNERFEKIAEATNDAIWDYDIVNDKLFRGKGFNSLFGYDMNNNAPKMSELLLLIHPEDQERIKNKFNKFLNSDGLTNWFEEYRLLCSEGHYAFVMDRAIFIRDKNGKVTRVVGAMTDITYRKEYEESLQAMNEQTAQDAKELERSNNELEQFAYIASHDLQEPLRMVSNFMGLLKRRHHDKLDEKAHQYIDFAVDGAMRMRQIILDLLEFSRIGKIDEKLKVLALADLVDEVCVLQKKKIKETKAKIKYKDLPYVISYKTPLFQVIYNLIGNALKYRNENNNPIIQIKAEEIEGFWQFSVADNGIGISPENHERIFTIFKRLHNKDKYEGTGMGLAIVKKIIDNLGGKVWVSSEIGEGATFYFTLPKIDSNLDGDESLN